MLKGRLTNRFCHEKFPDCHPPARKCPDLNPKNQCLIRLILVMRLKVTKIATLLKRIGGAGQGMIQIAQILRIKICWEIEFPGSNLPVYFSATLNSRFKNLMFQG